MAARVSRSSRTTAVIAIAAVGVYALLMAGATTAITDAAAACRTWPTCDGRWLVPVDDPRLLVAWGHRALALLVGIVVVAAASLSLRAHGRSRVTLALLGALGLYPFQVALGAETATATTPPVFDAVHLFVGLGIFGLTLLALTWRLTDGPTPESSSAKRPTPPAEIEHPFPTPSTARGGLRTTVLAYVRLTKPRLMWLLCLVAAAGMALAAGSSLSPWTAAATLLGGVFAIGASGTFNHVLERDVDRRMRRTADRPLATDRVGTKNATAFGVVLTVAAGTTFLSINALAAALGLAAIAYYSVVYTLVLKPNTVRNTVIGGLAGAFPAVIGAAAATNAVGPPALLLAAVIFLWTPAHFYNLALVHREDYERAGFPMLPVVHGERTTRKHVLLYLGATLVAAALLPTVSGLGWIYAATGVTFGAGFLWIVIGAFGTPSRARDLRSFYASNAYLGALLVAIILDVLAL